MIQNLVVTRGEPFSERFYLKNPDGSESSGFGYKFTIVIYRKDYVREFKLKNKDMYLEFKLTAQETAELNSNILSYKIMVNNKEVIAQGLLRVQ